MSVVDFEQGNTGWDIEKISKNLNHSSTNPTKWSNTLKQFVGNLPTDCLSVFDHFVKLAFNELKNKSEIPRGNRK